MTKVVFQSKNYWLETDFWRQSEEAGNHAEMLECRRGIHRSWDMDRDAFKHFFGDRVAGWVHSVDKSVSVFIASLPAAQKAKAMAIYRDAVVAGLTSVSGQFTARTGAQGKVRLSAEADFAWAIHDKAFDRSPHVHAHVAARPRVNVPDQNKTYATHTTELYLNRKLFQAVVNQQLGRMLQIEFGVRVEKTQSSFRLPDVPASLCRAASTRSRQIDTWLPAHGIPNTPLGRKLAALATRNQDADRSLGAAAFGRELLRSGFLGKNICDRVKLERTDDPKVPTLRAETRRVKLQARKMVRTSGSFTKNDLLAHALETASPTQSVSRVRLAVSKVLQSPSKGLTAVLDEFGRTIYGPSSPIPSWRKVARKLDHQVPTPSERLGGETSNDRTIGLRSDRRDESQNESDAARAKREKQHARLIKAAADSPTVIGAFGPAGVKFTNDLVEKFRRQSRSVRQINGVQVLPETVRSLKKSSRWQAHKAAVAAMFSWNGTFQEKLLRGETVYRQHRAPRQTIPARSLLVVHEAGRSNPRDIDILLAKANRAAATVVLLDADAAQSLLLLTARKLDFARFQRIAEQCR